MIKSELFYAAFSKGIAEACPVEPHLRRRGKIPKYAAATPVGPVDVWFQVHAKASALPYQPGQFWPVVQAVDLRCTERDNGSLSWYQYADDAGQREMLEQQKAVMAKVAGQQMTDPDIWGPLRDGTMRLMATVIEVGFSVGSPHTPLFYLDEKDALDWGRILGRQLPPWLARFCAAPETLAGYMVRAHRAR